MTPTQTTVYQLAMVLAAKFADGESISAVSQIAVRLIAAAVSSATTDSSATLSNAASSAASSLGGGL